MRTTKSVFAIRGAVDYDPTMAMLAMTMLVYFWVLYWATAPPARTQRPNLRHYNAA